MCVPGDLGEEELESQLVAHGCWELTLDPLEEQQVLQSHYFKNEFLKNLLEVQCYILNH